MTTFSIPASIANLGSGFDVMGMAVSLRMEVDVTPHDELTLVGAPEGVDPHDNRLIHACQSTLTAHGCNQKAQLTLRSSIPPTRGCGSSGAAIALGVAAALHLANLPLSLATVMAEALPYEGHPDNLAASLWGGITIARGARAPACITPPPDVDILLFVPDHSVSTHEARAVLPPTVSRADAVATLGAVALLIHALESGDLSLLDEGTRDWLHQDARDTHGDNAVLRTAARTAGALGAHTAGAGPTTAIWCRGAHTTTVIAAVTASAAQRGLIGNCQVVRPEREGLLINGSPVP